MDIEMGIFLYAICCSKQYKEDDLLTNVQYDKYQERVIYNKAGEEKRIVNEPLSEHKGHGSNKKDKL